MFTTINEYKLFLEKKQDKTKELVIVDVQEDFKKYFNDKYLEELNKYCYQFGRVFNIWDSINSEDHYVFPSQAQQFEKQYGGELQESDIDYYFAPHIVDEVKSEWKTKKSGWHKETTSGDCWLYVNGSHEWFYINKDMLNWVKGLAKTNREVTLVGGAGNANGDHDGSKHPIVQDENNIDVKAIIKSECLYDIYIMLKTFGVNVITNDLYIYSAKGCRFKEKE
jgi:hypothetical protein